MAGNEIANTFNTYNANDLREDLTDVIWNVSPTETPFCTSIAKAKATQPLHQWQTDVLAAANTANACVQGDDITSFDAVTATVRLTNNTQISRKDLIISNTQEASIKAGMKSEVAYQVQKKGRELRRDIESILLLNQAAVASASGTAPTTAGVPSWLVTNINMGAGGAAPNGLGTNTRTTGTDRTFTESLLKNVLELVFTNAGDQPDMMLVPPTLKQTTSTFPGNATRYMDAAGKEIIAGVDVYESDFGSLKIIPDRFADSATALVINSDLWALAWLRPIQLITLATTGDASKRLIIGEYALEARNEKGNGAVYDVTA
jgi:Family of unknown function (DUF5309)